MLSWYKFMVINLTFKNSLNALTDVDSLKFFLFFNTESNNFLKSKIKVSLPYTVIF
jgi:hypothetical protein